MCFLVDLIGRQEEMESLGPLIKSSSTSEVPQGEDGACSMSDDASPDAVSYTYLKLGQEQRHQEAMVASLHAFEELLEHSGWNTDHYRKSVFNCLKSLGHYFSLCGNTFYRSLHLSTSLLISLYLSTSHYISLHLTTSHYISLHLFTSLTISLHLSTSLYISLHLSRSLYISLHLTTSL